MTGTASRIAALNDAFRRAGPNSDWVITRTLHEHGPDFVASATRSVMRFEAFGPDDDPYGEHGFGALVVDGVKVWFKIDCYDQALEFGSPDPADERLTRRVMTIMLPDDY